MKKLLVGVFCAILGTSAQAATLDFLGDANNEERGVASGTTYSNAFTGGLTLTLTAGMDFNPYFDGANAGLGVCQVLDNEDQCDPSSDDNVTDGESVTIDLNGTYNLSNFLFTGEGHSLSAGIVPLATDETLLFGINGGALSQTTFALLSAASFMDVQSFTLAFDDDGNNAEQFYLASVVATPIPVPAALPLLIAGIGSMAWVGRRRKTA